jgi:uncharacterized protein YecE (DUF72 family)
MKGSGHIHIGTSGWHYDHWRGPFYRKDLPDGEMLACYAQSFRTAEINNSFYKLPSKETFATWRDTVPEDFVFSVKANRFITHMKKLKDPMEPLENFYAHAMVLEDKLGPTLFQLPPRWTCNVERLSSFLGHLGHGCRSAFEFRDHSWFNEEVYEALRAAGAAFCIYDLAGKLSPKIVTAPFVYVRLHGPNGPYRGQYDDQTLADWLTSFATWVRQGREIFCYFDNDEAGYAAQDALRLQKMANA